jgi:hypothetical protein
MNRLLIKAKNNFDSLTNNEKNQLNYFVFIIDNNRYNTINIIINKLASWFNITEETLSKYWRDDEWYSAGLELFDITLNTIYSNKNIYHLWIAINNYLSRNNQIQQAPDIIYNNQNENRYIYLYQHINNNLNENVFNNATTTTTTTTTNRYINENIIDNTTTPNRYINEIIIDNTTYTNI